LYYNNWGRNFDSDKEYDHTKLSLYPSINYFVADKLSMGLFTGLSWTDYCSISNSFTENTLDFTVGLQGEYYFIREKRRKDTVFPSLGTSLSMTLSPEENNTSYINMNFSPHLKLNYFVNRSIAPYIQGGVNMNFLMYKKDNSNIVKFNFTDELEISASFFIGFSYYIPSENPNKYDHKN
jgi:hypothetical protein